MPIKQFIFSVGSHQGQHVRGGVQVQQPQYVRTIGDQSGQSATITYNPRTQRITANVPGTSVQQPVQLVQVGSVSCFELLDRLEDSVTECQTYEPRGGSR